MTLVELIPLFPLPEEGIFDANVCSEYSILLAIVIGLILSIHHSLDQAEAHSGNGEYEEMSKHIGV